MVFQGKPNIYIYYDIVEYQAISDYALVLDH